MTGQGDEFKFQAPYSKPSIKLSTYDGKSSWQVYKTQFSIVADANQWDSHTKACQLAASLRADAADILQTLPETQRLDFDASLMLWKSSPDGGSQGLKGGPSVCYEIRGSPASNTKGQTPHTSRQRIGHANSSVERLERQMRSFLNRVESLMSQKADGKKTLKCWTCGREGHLQRSCRARQGAETNSALPEGGVGKLINGHLVGRRLPDFGKPHFQVCQISTKSTDIADPFILGLDFLKEHGFTLDFNKNELRSIHEEVTIFKIKHRTESIRQKSSAERLFQEFEDVFSRNSSDIGHTTVTQHRIDTADHPPIKQHPRRLPFAKQEEVGTLLREMQENDIIEPSTSPWASPIVLVRKKDGSTRFCVDY
ncbi:retrovirus-related Pol polyprotein from transposon 412 [Trichonephila clavipes]|nr:retrovirus-related Pol polyprotein from transposon 412 [Trichonephila clavipes]